MLKTAHLFTPQCARSSLQIVAYGLQPNLNIDNWQQLRPLRLGAQLGIKYFEMNMHGYDVTFTANPETLFQMLKRGRLDVLLFDRNTALTTMSHLRHSGDPDKLLGNVHELGILANRPLYHYLQVKNEALIPQLDKILRDMTKEGLISSSWHGAEADQAKP